MRKIGQRDADTDVTDNFDDQEPEGEVEWTDDDPLFVDEATPVRCHLPGRPEVYVDVLVVSDGVSKGRARFYRSQSQATKRGQPDITSTTVDAEGLALYIREHAITDFCFPRKAGQPLRFNAKSPGENRATYKKMTGRFATWVDEQIQSVNGWGEEEDEKRERFPDTAAGAGAPAE